MKIELNLQEIQLTRQLLKKEVRFYELLKNHAPDNDAWVCYDLDQLDYVKLLRKINKAYEKACEEVGELPF